MSDISKVFYINLEHRTDRRDFMEEQLGRLGIDYERFSAVEPSIESLLSPDGAYHDFFRRATQSIKSFTKTRRLQPRAIGIFGCYISQYRIHQRMAVEPPGNYVILEDDCRFRPESLAKLYAALHDSSIPPDWDIVRNCWKSKELFEKFHASHKESAYSTKNNSHDTYGGAHFSLFRGASAQSVIDHLDGDYVFDIDAAYSTDRLNVYHGKLGFSHAPMGTDIPKLSPAPLYSRAFRKAMRILKQETR